MPTIVLAAVVQLACGSDSSPGKANDPDGSSHVDSGADQSAAGTSGREAGSGGASGADASATGGSISNAGSPATGGSAGTHGTPVPCTTVPTQQVLDFNSAGSVASLRAAFVLIRGSAQVRFEAAGIGVVGGTADSAIDSGEMLDIDFDDAGAIGVSYTPTLAGAATLEGFDVADRSLGTQSVSTSSVIDVSGLFGSRPVGRFTVTAVEPHRVTDLTYSTRPMTTPGITFAEYPIRLFGTLNWNGLGVQGSSTLTGGIGSALGVAGGAASNLIDGNEVVSVTFHFSPVTEVWYRAELTQGDVSVEGLDALGQTLGSVTAGGAGVIDVSALFGDVPLSGFRVHASGGSTRLAEIGALGCVP